ncbi:hypothetical protein A3L09_10670 (plasmid) [Thermococcus profundus]|uniref:Uncharacterized protein n=1 Tax=Thermococcus profundus TaxID=49899 RepID=A0A2Z2ME11_THEPR|nr:hypothetical protein [Thermococcus profundus]ASJ03813.1 hypothetical protein A3L09_10670 [Thermococcus profundus]
MLVEENKERLEKMEEIIYTALLNSGITGEEARRIAKGIRAFAEEVTSEMSFIKGIRLLLQPEGPSFFCVGCGSRHISYLGTFIPTDPEVLELAGYRIIVYGICEKCMREHPPEYFESQIVKLLWEGAPRLKL